MTRCITDYLVQEHQELSHLAREPRSTAERLSRLTRAVGEALRAHLVREEQILYPALERHVQGIAGTLDRMRHDHDAGEETEKAYLGCLTRLLKGGRNRDEVMQSGRQYVQWLRRHLLDENGRLFPMVERGLDPETQQEVRRAMEELSQVTSARVSEGSTQTARA
jgi:hemerythrin-like domain-containing protein